MTIVQQQSETAATKLGVARRVHPEDISEGDYLALSEVSFQYPSFFWCGTDTTMFPPAQPIRVTFLPVKECEPLKVISICLPFVFCELVNGKHKVFDIRQVQFTKLDRKFATTVRSALNSKQKKKRQEPRKKRKQR